MAERKSFNWVPDSLKPYVNNETIGGILLILAALIAFIIANTPWEAGYHALQHRYLSIHLDEWSLEKSLLHWVNDGLMVLFFLMVGLEIKREILAGHLSNKKDAALSGFAALGGMVVPALIYVAFNFGQSENLSGWGIPMATDIAFAIGVLSLLGSSVPVSLKVFLTALAIVDDIGAVIVIALFYTDNLVISALFYSLIALALSAVYGWFNGKRVPIYLLFGVIAWYFMLKSGVHATVAGVLLAFTIPMVRKHESLEIKKSCEVLGEEPYLDTQHEYEKITTEIRHAYSPLHSLEHSLHPLNMYIILPIFAFFNAGVTLGGEGEMLSLVTAGAFFGLIIGKPIGIFGASWISTKFGWSSLPEGVTWSQIFNVGMLAGIGFTMSFFISNLAFQEPELLDQAKIGVLSASVLAAILGLVGLRFSSKRGK